MKDYIVKDLMVPLSEYATVPEGATLFEAIMALEQAQEQFDHTKYRHRAVLVLDKNKRVIGKLSQLDVLRAIERKDEQFEQIRDLKQFKFSNKFIYALREQHRLAWPILKDAYKTAASMKVENFMQAPSDGEYVDETTSMDTAIHQLVSGTHLSLLVTRNKEIVGILRMSDVFGAVFHAMKESELET